MEKDVILDSIRNVNIRQYKADVGFRTLIEGVKEALLDQFELEELHINLIGENGRSVNVDYAALPIELRRQIDYTTITVVEIKVDNEERAGGVSANICKSEQERLAFVWSGEEKWNISAGFIIFVFHKFE